MQLSKTVSLFIMIFSFSTGIEAFAANDCDRACLEGHVDKYMAALQARDYSSLALAKNVRFTENIFEIEMGKGLWGTVTATNMGKDDFKIYVADPEMGQVGFIGVVHEHDKPGLFSLRLKIENQLITEIETMHSRKNFFSLNNLETSREAFSKPLKASEQSSRQKMIATAIAYGDSVEQGDGKAAPFADDCQRHENGMQTTGVSFLDPTKPGPGCADQMSSGAFDNTDGVTNRRFPIVDEERGLVMGYFVFQLPGLLIEGPPALEGLPDMGPLIPFSGPVTEVFKIRNGNIHEIEAVLMPVLPYGAGTGW